MPRAPGNVKVSAGLLLYRVGEGRNIEFLLGHPGGPFWAHKDVGAWSIPKGEVEPGEELLEAAKREVREETGFVPPGPYVPLGHVVLKSGKVVHAWGASHEGDAATITSNLITIESPRGSGRSLTFPELDRAGYFGLEAAREKLNPAQVAFVDRLFAHLTTNAAEG